MTCEQKTHAPRTRARWTDIDWAAIDWTSVNWAETASPRINWVDFYRDAPTIDTAGGTTRPARGTSAATGTEASDTETGGEEIGRAHV